MCVLLAALLRLVIHLSLITDPLYSLNFLQLSCPRFWLGCKIHIRENLNLGALRWAHLIVLACQSLLSFPYTNTPPKTIIFINHFICAYKYIHYWTFLGNGSRIKGQITYNRQIDIVRSGYSRSNNVTASIFSSKYI